MHQLPNDRNKHRWRQSGWRRRLPAGQSPALRGRRAESRGGYRQGLHRS